MNSVKLFLGNVYLTIPHVFSKTGWLGGILLYSLVAILNSYTMIQQLEVVRRLSLVRDPDTGKPIEIKSYTDLAHRVHGPKGKYLVVILLFIVQFSCCVSYLYFVSIVTNIILCDEIQVCGYLTEYKLIMLAVTIPLCLLKTYTYLSYVSMAGIACASVGGFMLVGYCADLLFHGSAD